jgi:Tfp pilus assembly protein FimT
MTLLEVLLTLCLLVILAALTWPAVGRPVARQRLREGADQVRAAWVRARVKAMSTGRLHVFRVAPDGDGFLIEPQGGEDDSSTLAPAEGSEVAGELGDAATPRSQSHRLPDKVRFVAAQTAYDPRAAMAAVGAAASADMSASGNLGPGLSDPIYFFADGTCSSVQVWLANEYNQTIDLSLRGLTGVVTLGEVGSAEAGSP